MAIIPANSHYKSFTFHGISAADYGVYVTDVNVFNSAERAVEFITIPGRNGSFALDHGRFENITVVYSCAIGQKSDTDFATAISDFRNALASATGYQRLEDDMNPGEYRLAVFSKGVEAPTLNQKTATFDVEFNCKPQRYLTSGDTPVTITSGGTIINPTLFDASPTLYVDGYGTINIGDNTVTINNAPYGNLLLANATTTTGAQTLDAGNYALLNTGDRINVITGTKWQVRLNGGRTNIASGTGIIRGDAVSGLVTVTVTPGYTAFDVSINGVGFVCGTTETKNATLTLNWTDTDGNSYTGYLYYAYMYEAATGIIRIENTGQSGFDSPFSVEQHGGYSYAVVNGWSTKTPASGTITVDMEIGEAYTESGGVISSANAVVSMPAKLPTLAPGSNTITYDNTITGLEITPKWWKV